MKVTQVSLCPTEASIAADRPSLTPELLAASGARYSRNNDGLEAILSKIDPQNLDKSVDGIFKMIDYGHQSIADMAPVAMFLDGLSMWLAYLVWTQVPTAGGQESSTRYLELTKEDLVDASSLGIPSESSGAWRAVMEAAMESYDDLLTAWQADGHAHPELTRIPKTLLDDPSDKAQKAVARMQRNYAFDRARYFLPSSLRTNMMLVMSARSWVQLCQFLLSHGWVEAHHLGSAIRDELGVVTPRLLKHATAKPSFIEGLRLESKRDRQFVESLPAGFAEPVRLDIDAPVGVRGEHCVEALLQHDNRYAYFGEAIRRTSVRFAWGKMSFAEIRDLNRHRTGTKYCPAVPRGFYCAEDQAEHDLNLLERIRDHRDRILDAIGDLKSSLPAGLVPATMLLGHELYFEHTTTADKFLYEAELRTGTGAHYRYAQHLHDALSKWYERFPETRGLVLEGSAEPE